MTSKYCTKCKETKHLFEFSKDKTRKDGLQHECKECNKQSKIKCNHSEIGHISRMFSNMKANSKRRGHLPPRFTLGEFVSFCYSEGYVALHSQWALSDYHRDYAPSADRTDDYRGYCLSRLQLGTWKENRDRGHADRKNGINNKHSKAVRQLNINGDVVAEFHSIMESGRRTGITVASICKCCTGALKTTGGFLWEYK